MKSSSRKKFNIYRDALGGRRSLFFGKNEITKFCAESGDQDLYIRHAKENSKAYYTQWILTDGIRVKRSLQIKSTNSLAVKNSRRDAQLKNEAKNLVDIDVEEHLEKVGLYISNHQKRIFPPKSNLERSLKDKQLIQIAKSFENSHKIVVHKLTGDTYRYNEKEKYYVSFDQKELAHQLNLKYKEKFLADEVSKIFGAFSRLKKEAENYIALKNCLLNLDTLETEPFDHKKFVTFRAPYRWNPEAKSDFFEEKLKEILGDNLEFFLQMVGYCFAPNNPHHKLFFLTGDGSNGKSTLMALIHAIFHESIAAVGLHEFQNDFGLQPLIGKKINILYDLPEKAITDTGHIKAVTGQDRITINCKFKEPVTTQLGCKIIGVGNNLPLVIDDSYAFWRRVMHIELTNTFTDNKDVKLTEKLIDDTEGMEWLIYQAIMAYKNVELTGWACENTEEQMRRQYLLRSDPCLYAAEQLFEKTIDPDDYITRDQAVSIISDYLKTLKINLPKDNKPYYRAIRRIGGDDTDKRIDGQKVRVFSFIKQKTQLGQIRREVLSALETGG